MSSLRLYCEVFEKFGTANFSRSSKFQYVYMTCVYSIIITYSVCHDWSTFTRATRYLPEFFQTLLEGLATNVVVGQILNFNQQYKRIIELGNLMESSFCTFNSEVIEKGRAKSKKTIILIALCITLTMSGAILQTIIPLTSEELEIQKNVYRTKHPERIPLTVIKIPFIDETESWYYEAIMVWELYLGLIFIAGVTVICTFIPNVIYFMEAQYTILCQHVENLGTKLRDSQGQRFFYNNLEKNEIAYLYSKQNKNICRPNKTKISHKQRIMNEKVIEQKYEKLYIRQIIYFHQKLLQFQQKMETVFSPQVLPLVICNNIALSMCLYQLTRYNTLSKVRIYKFSLESLTIALQFFFLNNCSEIMDDCNAMVCRSINSSHWQHCTRDTKRGLMSLLRICQRPNHLKFYGGAIILSRVLFLNVVKIAYSFVNFMRMNSRKGN
ncbi:hypothetical protein M8J77_001695 [Diaphorina citri]|nr:hypothetical protein M8J77_001695 [Diaphorina citri]